MNAERAAEVILVQAVEAVDEDGEILSFKERSEANAALEGEGAGSLLEAMAERAGLLAPHIKRRAPWLWHMTRSFATIPWSFGLLCIGLAMFFGASLQVLDGGKTFHVLSKPLIGLMLWNFVSVGLLLLGPMLWRRMRLPALKKPALEVDLEAYAWGRSMTRAVLWLRRKWVAWRMPTSGDLVQTVSARALDRFWSEWPRHAEKLLQAQVTRIFHLCNIAFCLSALLVAYSSGLTKAYRATAESTFLSAGQVEFLVGLILWPSRLILGGLPSMKAGVTGTLGPAAPWIHHYAVTLFLLVMLPRLVLLAWSWGQCLWLTSRLPLSMSSLSQVPTLNIALASHTNVGKTSLARTLLRRDVGEVRDAMHVTRRRAGYFLIQTETARLRLWDTPGFGDAKALLENLREHEGWAWLRALQTPELRFDREAALTLKEEADLILYLVPAHATLEEEQMIREEWQVLEVIGCPVVCVLNRLEGAGAAEEEKLLEGWRAFFADQPLCRGVIALDAFSRSLDDERLLFDAIEQAVEPEKKPLAAELRAHWEARSRQRHRKAAEVVAAALKRLAKDSEPGTGKEAVARLQQRAQKVIATAQDELLGCMELKGALREKMIEDSERFLRSVIPNRGERTIGAIIGGALSGLATGIVTDFLAGGLTFFGGAAIGMVVGALGGAGVAEGYRRTGQRGARKLIWEQDFLQGVALRLTLLYLAAASFGRARGEFTDEVLGANSEGVDASSEAKQTEHQARLFEAVEYSLGQHWPYLWPLLAVKHDANAKKLWDDLALAGAPVWARGLLTAKAGDKVESNVEATDSETVEESGADISKDPLKAGCEALLDDALLRWKELR